MKEETNSQLLEFQQFMSKSMAGDLTLIDEFNSAQLAIQAAVSSAFKTPEVIRLFAQKQPDALRQRLAHLRAELKLKHLSVADFNQQSTEILIALKKLDIPVSIDHAPRTHHHHHHSTTLSPLHSTTPSLHHYITASTDSLTGLTD